MGCPTRMSSNEGENAALRRDRVRAGPVVVEAQHRGEVLLRQIERHGGTLD